MGTNRRIAGQRTLVNLSGLLVLLVAAALAFASCSGGDTPKKAKQGESCELTKDCKKGLLCRDKICVDKKMGADAGNVDGESGDGSSTDTDGGSEPVEREDYFVSYIERDALTDKGTLKVFSTKDGSHTDVSSRNCTNNCWLSTDMKYFVYTERAGMGKSDIMVAEVGSNLKSKGNAEALLTEVEDVSFHGNYVSYVKTGSASRTARYMKLSEIKKDKETDRNYETIGNVEDVSDDWHVDPENDVGVLYKVGNSSQSMEISAGKASDRKGDGTFTLGGPNFQKESGSYFGGSVPSAISRDGRLVAFATTGAPNDYALCNGDPWKASACKQKGKYYKCGTEDRCVRLEVAVHFIDLKNADKLGEKCRTEEACGPYQECYIPSNQQLDTAKCIPGRVVLGVPLTPKQGEGDGKLGCQIVAEDDSIDFTSIHGPLSFDKDHNLYAVGIRERFYQGGGNSSCPGDYDTHTGQVVKIDPEKRTYDILEGLTPDKEFDPGACWNSAEKKLSIDGCGVYVDKARVSPEGNEIVFAGTNPNTDTVGDANRYVGLWHMLRDVSDRWFTGDKNTSATEIVRAIWVHPPK